MVFALATKTMFRDNLGSSITSILHRKKLVAMYLYHLVEKELLKRSIEEKKRILRKRNEEEKNMLRQTLEDAMKVVFQIASLVHKYICCGICFGIDAESVAAILALFCPIWIAIFPLMCVIIPAGKVIRCVLNVFVNGISSLLGLKGPRLR